MPHRQGVLSLYKGKLKSNLYLINEIISFKRSSQLILIFFRVPSLFQKTRAHRQGIFFEESQRRVHQEQGPSREEYSILYATRTSISYGKKC